MININSNTITLSKVDIGSLPAPTASQYIFGVDTDGIPKLLGSDSSLSLYQDSLLYTSVSFAQFVNLINTDGLQPGGTYLITDFQTRYYLQYTDITGDGTGGGEIVNVGNVEPLVILALTNNTYNSSVKSTIYPDDEILWRHDTLDRVYDYANNPSGVGKGCISYRKSINGNSREYDFRSVVFRRWNDGSGNYIVYRKIDADNPGDFIDFIPHDETYPVYNNIIGSCKDPSLWPHFSPYVSGLPYYSDNLVICTPSVVYANNISLSHGVNIIPDAIGNEITDIVGSNIVGYSFSGNSITQMIGVTSSDQMIVNILGYIYNTSLGTFSGNNISSIGNSKIQIADLNTGSDIQNVDITTMEGNNFSELINISSANFSNNDIKFSYSNNIPICINNNLVTLSNNSVDQLDNNIGTTYSYNTISGNISFNSSDCIIDNISGSITNNISNEISHNTASVTNISNNSVSLISSNSVSGDISYNIGIDIVSNSCGEIVGNNVSIIEGNYSGEYSANFGSDLSFNYIGTTYSNNSIIEFTGNSLYFVNNNNGSTFKLNSGSHSFILDNKISTLIGNTFSGSLLYNTIISVCGNILGTVSNNIGSSMSNNTISKVLNNNFISLSGNKGSIISDNNVKEIINNLNIGTISQNTSNAIDLNTTPIITSNNTNTISNNTITLIDSNTSNLIYGNSDSVKNGGIIQSNVVSDITSNSNFSSISTNTGNSISYNSFTSNVYSGGYATFGFSGTPSIGDIATISFGPYKVSATSASTDPILFAGQLYSLFPSHGFTATYSSTTFEVIEPSSSTSYQGATFCVIVKGPNNALLYPTFSGSVNDLSVTITGFTNSVATHYVVVITSTGTPDRFYWMDDKGNSASNVSCVGSPTLSYGAVISFGSSTGHGLSDNWDFEISPSFSYFAPTFSGHFIGESSSNTSNISGNNILNIINNYNCNITNNDLLIINNCFNFNCMEKLFNGVLVNVTASTSAKISGCFNIGLDTVVLNGNIINHTFLDTFYGISLTPSTNMTYGTYSTVSRYLFNLGASYEEIALSSGLTYSGPIS